jgi:DNA modification methylase
MRRRTALPAPPSKFFTIHRGDARNLDALLRPYSNEREPLVTATITSPPYGDLKNYGHPDQIGFGQAYEEYLVELRRVFRTVYTHTRDDGSLWLIADSLRPGESGVRTLEPLPFQIATDLADIGWSLREVIIWKKDKTLPWSGHGRLRNAFEYLLLFVKSGSFKFHVDRLRDPEELEEWWVKWPERYNPAGKVPDNVWEFPIPVQGSWGTTAIQHACPLPPDLVQRMLLLSTDPGDVVLDPFAGSGVVVAESERLGRRSVGVELVKRHITSFERFVRPEILERTSTDHSAQKDGESDLPDKILKLRTLKYARVVMKEMTTKFPELPRPALAVALLKRAPSSGTDSNMLVNAQMVFAYDTLNGEVSSIYAALQKIAGRQPASKFQVGSDFVVATRSQLPDLIKAKRLFLYTGGRTHMTVGRLPRKDLLSIEQEPNRANCQPIVSNVEISEQPARRSAGSAALVGGN